MASTVDAVMGKIELRSRNSGGSIRPPRGQRKYSILRVKKIGGKNGRGKANLSAAARHNLRERETPNARPEDISRNIHLAGARTAAELMKLWDERAPEKVRKNAVPALEYVMSASPEKMAEMGQARSEDYLRDAFAWLEEKHGAQNILSAVIHMDETTPHLQVLVIPIDERGKLNARALVGSKKELSAMQTDYAERVGARYGLERGVLKSGARHETIKSYYGRANTTENLHLSLPERATGGFLGRGTETDAEYRARLSETLSERLRDVAATHTATLSAITAELAEAKLKLADTEEKLRTEYLRRHVLEVAASISLHEGDDKQDLVAKFQNEYLTKYADLHEETREIVDRLLEDMGGEGFWHIEQERLDREAQVTRRDPFASYRARSGADYMLTNNRAEHLDVIQLLKDHTTAAQYTRFRQGDLNAIDHITQDPVFSRQLLMEAEINNRSTGFEMSNETERRMSDSRDFLKSTFETDRDRGYENER